MRLFKFIFRLIFVSSCSSIFYYLIIKFFNSIFISESVIFPYAIHPFDLCVKIPTYWYFVKIIFKVSLVFNLIVIFNSIFSYLFPNKKIYKSKIKKRKIFKIKNKKNDLKLLVGKNKKNDPIFINEKGLFQNILITGTIGSGKTSSVMYPFCKQLISYSYNIICTFNHIF